MAIKKLDSSQYQLRRQGRPGSTGGADCGFTLIETSIAMVIMMVAGLAAISLFVYATQYNSGAQDRAAAVSIAQKRMEELRKAPFTDTLLNNPSDTETVTAASRRYTVQTTICSTSACGGSSTLKKIMVSVTPLDGSTSWSIRPVVVVSERSSPSVGAYLQ